MGHGMRRSDERQPDCGYDRSPRILVEQCGAVAIQGEPDVGDSAWGCDAAEQQHNHGVADEKAHEDDEAANHELRPTHRPRHPQP